jgi:acetyl-CoA synthetase
MKMLEKYVSKVNFDSYEDFYENFKIHVPLYFNFAYDVVDEIAKNEPDKMAMVWCDDQGNELILLSSR